MTETKPLVSIWCPTYNHENYIRDCLSGFVMQKTNFPFEIIVHDDASTDKTQEVIREFEKSYPHLFRCIYQTENQFSKNSAHLPQTMVNNVKGKYIALTEGDDYWLDPKKLQKQIDFLEKNQDYSICFHNVKVFNESTQLFVEDELTGDVNSTTTLTELSIRNYIHTPSVVFKNTFKTLPDLFLTAPIGDYPLWCITALSGNLHKMDEEMAVYRIHDKGLMKNILDDKLKTKIKVNDGMLPFYEYMFEKSGIANFRKTLIGLLIANQSYAVRDRNYKLAKKYSANILKKHIFQLSFKQLTSVILTFIFPQILRKYYGK